MCLLTKTQQTGSLHTYPMCGVSPSSQSPAADVTDPDQPRDTNFTQSTWDPGMCSSVAPIMQLAWIVYISSSI